MSKIQKIIGYLSSKINRNKANVPVSNSGVHYKVMSTVKP